MQRNGPGSSFVCGLIITSFIAVICKGWLSEQVKVGRTTEDTARECYYCSPRRGGTLDGASVRLLRGTILRIAFFSLLLLKAKTLAQVSDPRYAPICFSFAKRDIRKLVLHRASAPGTFSRTRRLLPERSAILAGRESSVFPKHAVEMRDAFKTCTKCHLGDPGGRIREQ